MKFRLSITNGWVHNPSKEKLLSLGFYEDIEGSKKFSTAKEVFIAGEDITREISTLEELIAFLDEYGGDCGGEKALVLLKHSGEDPLPYEIEIYNTYRE